VPGVFDAYAEALEGWAEALVWPRGSWISRRTCGPASAEPAGGRQRQGQAPTGIAERRGESLHVVPFTLCVWAPRIVASGSPCAGLPSARSCP